MSPEQHQTVRDIFDKALEQPEADRLSFVAAECKGDVTIYQSVVRLLDAKKDASQFLQNPARTQERMGRYLVTGELGRGAMGIVYEAVDPLIGRNVALKIIHFQAQADSKEIDFLRDRLFREARAAGRLFHPGIVVVLDVGQEGSTAYIAMERVEGPTLLQVLATTEKLPTAQVIDILRQAAAALDYAHQNGVVHRDIKPGNIMLHKGNVVKVADFGIAKSSATTYGTMPGMMLGTPSYMSPEQIEAAPVDGRSDQFALAVVAFEMLSGQRPFQGDSIATLAHMIAYGPRPSVRTANPIFGPALDQVLHRALARSPKERYDTCAQFVNALEEALSRAPEPVRPSISDAPTEAMEAIPAAGKVTYPATGWVKYVLAAAGLAVLAAAGWLYWLYQQPNKKQAAQVVSPPPAAQVAAPAIRQFVSDPASLTDGSSGTLRWDVANATDITIDPGIGKVAASGTVEIKPHANTVYTLTARGPGGPTSSQVSVQVAPPAPAAPVPPVVKTPVKAARTPKVDNNPLIKSYHDSAVEERQKRQPRAAASLYRQAADLGDIRSMEELAELLLEDGPAKNEAEAARWFQKAAESGSSMAMLNLGSLYYDGTGVAQNDALAAKWWRKAADAGSPAGMYDLGTLYEEGRGVPRDLAKARELYEKAAQNNNAEAAKRLRSMPPH
jgi:tRNA A-37 threonylcarbamoyl transferase component Bud32